MEMVESFTVTARLDANPRYAGSSHDDATARAMGFRAALIPGAFLYGHMTRLAVRAWGMDWLRGGQAEARFRRPVYDGDRLIVGRSAWVEADGKTSADAVIRDAESGEVLVSGHIALPDKRPEPPHGLQVIPLPDPIPEATSDQVVPGKRLGARGRVLSLPEVRQSLADFGEQEPIYEGGTLVHSGCLVRQTMGDTLANFRFPEPVVFVAVKVQNYAPVRAGALITSSTRIQSVYNRKGRLYFDSEEYLIADDLPVARHLRVNLYGRAE
jgi:acyl dehydratase